MKRISYKERAIFYDFEVKKDREIVNFLKRLSQKVDIKRVVNCPCASGIYLLDFANNYQCSYFVDIDNVMLEKVNNKIKEYSISNVEALQLNIKEIDKLNELVDCVIVLNQGLQYIELKEFELLLNKLEINYLILDLFDFKKVGTLTYFKSDKMRNSYYLTRKFRLNKKQVKRYNKFNWDNNKINFTYKYYINNVYKYMSEFQLYNYDFNEVCKIINSSKYELYGVYGNYNFEKYEEKNGHYILILRRCDYAV